MQRKYTDTTDQTLTRSGVIDQLHTMHPAMQLRYTTSLDVEKGEVSSQSIRHAVVLDRAPD